MEHPHISEMNQFGYLKGIQGYENMVQQPEHAGIDLFGTEIIEGDEIVIDKANFEELILKEHLKRYLVERCDFVFFDVRGMGVVLDQFKLTVFAEQDLEKVLHEEYGFHFTIAE
jgi:hypothetical protein